MPPWIAALITLLGPELVDLLKQRAKRRQLMKDFSRIDRMDISADEKRLMRRALVEKYNEE